MRYVLLVTGPAYGTQQATSALMFARALIEKGHQLEMVFFYREGVANGNQLTSPASDEWDLVREWQLLANTHGVRLVLCVAAALRRGIQDKSEAEQQGRERGNLESGFVMEGLGSLSEATLTCDRLVQF